MNIVIEIAIGLFIKSIQPIFSKLCEDIIFYVKQVEEVSEVIELNENNVYIENIFKQNYGIIISKQEIDYFKKDKSSAKLNYVLRNVKNKTNEKFIKLFIELFVYNIFNIKKVEE